VFRDAQGRAACGLTVGMYCIREDSYTALLASPQTRILSRNGTRAKLSLSLLSVVVTGTRQRPTRSWNSLRYVQRCLCWWPGMFTENVSLWGGSGTIPDQRFFALGCWQRNINEAVK